MIRVSNGLAPWRDLLIRDLSLRSRCYAILSINKLAVISGQCDLLSDHLKDGSQCAKRVIAIRGIAREMAKDLDEYHHKMLESRSTRIEELDVA